MLEGYDKDWYPITGETKATYTNLSSGKYTFKVKSMNEMEIWNKEPNTFEFAIKPPFWSTWWLAVIQIVFFVSLLGASIYFNRTNSESKVAAVLVFVTVLIAVECIAVSIENYTDSYTGGIPIAKLVINILLALSFAPIENIVIGWMKKMKEVPLSTLLKRKIINWMR